MKLLKKIRGFIIFLGKILGLLFFLVVMCLFMVIAAGFDLADLFKRFGRWCRYLAEERKGEKDEEEYEESWCSSVGAEGLKAGKIFDPEEEKEIEDFFKGLNVPPEEIGMMGNPFGK
jgi:hypothetical protein